MKYIGAHVTASGGVENAPLNASQIGANAFALFTKNQRQWKSTPLSEKSIKLFKKNCEKNNLDTKYILPHDSYLINLGSPDEEGLMKSRDAVLDEMQRCEQFGINLLNFHPGSHLKHIIDKVEDKSRVGICIDTCHTYSAGYDLVGNYENVFKELDEVVGLDYLKAIHLNDSKKELGSRVDRHESIGKGTLGIEFFKRFMKDSRFDNIPIVLETPDETIWADEIKLLRSFETE